MTSTAVPSGYASILGSKKILYMPSCLLVEMMTRLYREVSNISMTGSLVHLIPNLHFMLKRLTFNLDATAQAYRESRIKFFIGDWQDDKLRFRKLFFNIMSRLGYICEFTGAMEKQALYEAIEDMTSAWTELNRIMEERAGPRSANGTNTSMYFRSHHPVSWRQDMAKAIMSLNGAYASDQDTHLIVLCYKRIRDIMLKTIDDIEGKTGVAWKFPKEKILCVSDEEVPIACPTCTTMADSLRTGTCEVDDGPPRRGSDTTSARRRMGEKNSTVLRRRRTTSRVALGGCYPPAPSLGVR